MKPLRSALLGVTGEGANFLEAIRLDDQFDLVAVADCNATALRSFSDSATCKVFEDYRMLIVESARSGLDVLFVALEPFESVEFVELAAKHGVSVFHKSPPSRNTREARHLAERFAQKGATLVVARPWAFEPEFAVLNRLEQSTGRIHLCDVRVSTTKQADGWRGDSRRAGGGVLLNGAYEAIDLMTQKLGEPEVVYAQCGVAVSPESSPNYDTEDIALLTLQFSRRCIASVKAMRGCSEASWSVTFSGSEAVVEVCEEVIHVRSTAQESEQRYLASYANRMEPAINAFGRMLLLEPKKFRSTITDHLSTLAVIEAAYLSSRTGAAESPRGVL